MKVGIICYSRVLHFFSLAPELNVPKHMVVSDVADIFVPLQAGFLVDPHENRNLLDTLLDEIPNLFANSMENESVFAPVIQAATEALAFNQCNGKVMIFHSSGLPTAEAPGKLKPHEDKKLLNTNKEHLLWNTQEKYYTQLATECVDKG